MSYLRSRPNTLIALALAVAGVLAADRSPVWTDTWVVIGIYALIALSVGISYGQAGILSMAQGAFAAVGAYAAAISSLRFQLPSVVGLALAMALNASLAYALARLVTRLAPLATALATLALGSIVEIVARNWDDVTGGYIGLAGLPGVGWVSTPLGCCILVWTMIVLVVWFYENLMRSAHGRALNVIRHDRLRAMADGVDVPGVLSAAFALSAAIAGSAGWVYAHYITYVSPDSLGTHVSISGLLMAVIGGAGYVLGPIVGTVLFNLLLRFLPAQEVEGLFYGGALIVVLLVAREGLLGLLLGGARRLGGRFENKAVPTPTAFRSAG